MNREEISKHVIIHDEKEIILSNGKRLCYLIACDYCQKLCYKAQCEIIKGITRNNKFFCNQKCHGGYHSTKQNVICLNCQIAFSKRKSQIIKSDKHFCSKSCATTYNNKHKKFGIRRSKMEKLIEEMLLLEYPDLKYLCNDKTIIGSELDFYFPEHKLAIQINGIVHYKPIYGQIKFDQISNLDIEKRIFCEKQNIKLFEIDCSQDHYLNKKIISERLSQIKHILAEKVRFELTEAVTPRLFSRQVS